MPLDEGIINSLPDEIKSEPSFAEMQKGDIAGVFKQAIDGQKALGRAIFLPDEKDPEDKRTEKINSIYDKLGRPKSHAEYDTKEIFGEVDIDPTRTEKYLKAFHEAGLSTKQASRIVKEYLEEVKSSPLSVEGGKEALVKGVEGKNNGWGDKLEENIGVAKAALAKFDADGELLAFAEESGLGNHPVFLRFLHAVGSQFKEDTTPNVSERSSGDKSSAQSKLATIMNDRKHPYWNRGMAGHDSAVAEVQELHKVIYGTEVVSVVGKN